VSALLCGCTNAFRPAVAEPPVTAAIPVNYSSAAATLNTMVQAMAAKTSGTDAYMGALADSTHSTTPGFHQFFHPLVVQRWESLTGRSAPADWDPASERRFFEYLANLRSDPYALEWTVDDNHPDTGAEANTDSLYRNYRVYSLAEDGAATIIARGSARLQFVRTSDNRWVITRWYDIVDPDVGPTPDDPDQLTLGARRLESQ
jgi:hypothetical protein